MGEKAKSKTADNYELQDNLEKGSVYKAKLQKMLV